MKSKGQPRKRMAHVYDYAKPKTSVKMVMKLLYQRSHQRRLGMEVHVTHQLLNRNR